jgi:hypothetical protein
MNPINLKVFYLDGREEDVTAIAADLVAFEAKFDLSVARLEQEIRLSHLFYIAWHVLKRQGLKEEFENWLETVSIVTEGSQQKK